MVNPASNFIANPFQHSAGAPNKLSVEPIVSKPLGASNATQSSEDLANTLDGDASLSDMEMEDSDDEVQTRKPAVPPPKARLAIPGLSALEMSRLRIKVDKALKLNGHEYLFIDKAACPLNDESKAKLTTLLSIFKHEDVSC